ncbi:MAG: CAP domain-containing protein [Sandaracinaceae bacterium]
MTAAPKRHLPRVRPHRSSTRFVVLGVTAALLMTGCVGRFSLVDPESDAGSSPRVDGGPGVDGGTFTPDSGPRPDGAPPEVDGGPPPMTDGGPPPEVDGGPPPGPCATVVCGGNARCEPSSGACICLPGFIDNGSDCVTPPTGDPSTRTEAEMCDAWNAAHVENGDWTGDRDGCDPGEINTAGIDDTMRRVNMFRWLSGMPAVGYDDADHQSWQECARMMDANNSLSHDPPSSWDCHTSGGAAAAGSSNIALGYSSAAASIDGYMRDRNTPSLGHRRWILATRLSSVQIGSSDRGHCLGVFNNGGSADRDWTAYPNEGYAPIGTVSGGITWSFQAHTISLESGADAEVVRVSDGAVLPVDTYTTAGGGPPRSVGFTPNGWTPEAGETYRITITGTSAGDITYEVNLVSC